MTPRRILFATQELDPYVPGGAGAVVAGLAAALGTDNDVTVVLAATTNASADGVEVVDPGSPDGTIDWFLERSRLVGERLGEIVAGGPVDLVEFCDFEALAWWALTNRAPLGLETTRLVVRLHSPIDAITESIGAAPPPMDQLGRLERLMFPMVDAVMVPSAAVGRWVVERYDIDQDRIVVAPPVVPHVAQREWRPGSTPLVVGFGRLSEQKGWHDLARAAVPVLESHHEAVIRIIGQDGWSATEDRPMSEVIRSLIPEALRDRFVLTGRMEREDALDAMSSAWAVVLPSRYETFCLAAHEARRAGFPVIVPDIPPFEPYRSGAGFFVYDGSIAGLTAALDRVVEDRAAFESLAGQPAPRVGDPTEAYLGPLPEPRHPNTQAGLATRAVTTFARSQTSEPAGLGVMRRLVRLVPKPVAGLLSRLLPKKLKARMGGREVWWAEEDRRAANERRARVERTIESGLYPEAAPRVSVVIPCFEQGEWVGAAVSSVFEQAGPPWEIVLVDDGSTDPETIAELDRLARWPRVTLIRTPNRGLSAARNAGIAAARGDFVVPLDADDELAPGFIEVMLGALEADPGAAFAHCWAELFGDVEAVWVPRPFNPYWQMFSNGIIGCVLLRRAAWEAVGGYDETMGIGPEDWDLWNRLHEGGWSQVRVDQPLFRYRKRAGSMSVERESAFEEAIQAIAERHPDRYRIDRLRTLKEEWYPFVSLLVGRTACTLPGDAEAVTEEATADAVAAARGKYVADLRHGGDPAEAVMLAERLEQTPRAACATSGRTAVWRRWALLDPEADLPGRLGDPLPGSDLHFGGFPDPAWTVDREVVPDGMRLIRQRPEEAGRLPDWVSAG
ncbi:MAG TPA: glycosyltransferase [Acidimicrobiia bacterium]|nr:glycosyltransferase [Acidimicrobiia bacterium]